MSREIKFRVWSEEDRKYRTDCRLTELFTIETGTPATVYSDEGDRFDIEQYTGLKDRNGKEIYEGDIVKYNNYFVITFKNGCFRIDDEYGHEAGYYLSDWRVVGNIHENPELLRGEDD